jgi:hypothetical protein
VLTLLKAHVTDGRTVAIAVALVKLNARVVGVQSAVRVEDRDELLRRE